MSSTDSSPLHYHILDVFTHTPYLGNPLAIVLLPTPSPSVLPLTKVQKQLIAREFNLSETVFLHTSTLPSSAPAASSQDQGVVVEIQIFTPHEELPFAGHPTVGSAWFLLTYLLPSIFPSVSFDRLTLKCPAGLIPVSLSRSSTLVGSVGVRLLIPNTFNIHEPTTHAGIRSTQTLLENEYAGEDEKHEVVSIVKGMAFILLEVTSEDALGKLRPYPERIRLPAGSLGGGEWEPEEAIQAVLALHVSSSSSNNDGGLVVDVRTRLFDGPMEDPATGSASCALASYLCTKRYGKSGVVNFVQGVEMGRKSEITVFVTLGGNTEEIQVELMGTAKRVFEGRIVELPKA